MITQSLAPGRLAAGLRIYAVGDVHGCLSQLLDLHKQIAQDLVARPVAKPLLIHLGDFADRGPDTAGVIDYLTTGRPPIHQVINLMGNHEELLLDGLYGGDHEAVHWLHNGGDKALASWGVDRGLPRNEWASQIPDYHLNFVSRLVMTRRIGSYFFVHAGVRPGVSLDQQSRHDMLWIREPFLSDATTNHGAVIVHGHTPEPEPVVRANRIGVDTGAVRGGRLTAVVLEEDRMAFLSC